MTILIVDSNLRDSNLILFPIMVRILIQIASYAF